jgi:hypothetical protein
MAQMGPEEDIQICRIEGCGKPAVYHVVKLTGQNSEEEIILLPGAWDRVRYSRTSCDFKKCLIPNSLSVNTPTRSALHRLC